MFKPERNEKLKNLIKEFLDTLDLTGENFDDTPRRVMGVWTKFLEGANSEPPDYKFFSSKARESITMHSHVTWGFCPHHLLPVRYNIHLGYIPNGKVVGLSKLARLADFYLTKLPLQEDLTVWLAKDLMSDLDAQGAACYIEGYHLCYAIRGIKSQDATFSTSAFSGLFETQNWRRTEFLNSVKVKGGLI